VGAAWREVAGAYAMFDGPDSPITRRSASACSPPAAAADLAAIEAFFAERGAPTHHEVSPLADPALLTLLPARGYRPVELTTVLHRPLPGPAPAGPRGAGAAPVARPIAPGEQDAWADASARGWGEQPELAAFMRDFGRVTARARGTSCFVAELEGEVVATGAVAVHGGVAVLAGASTIRRGAAAARRRRCSPRGSRTPPSAAAIWR
jgi:hypothetical protein